MRQRIKYIPAYDAREGMVLAEAACDRYMRTILPSGHELSDENLRQIVAHQVELICVTLRDLRTDEEVALEASTMAKRVLDAFERADLTDPVTAALFNQVLTYRSA